MKRTAIAILIAVLVVVIGGVLLFAGMSAVNFKLDKLDRMEYVNNTYRQEEKTIRIVINYTSEAVSFEGVSVPALSAAVIK